MGSPILFGPNDNAILLQSGLVDKDGNNLLAGLSGLGSTDNAVLRANGTDGDTAQGSGVVLDDADAMLFPCGANDTANAVQFQTGGQGFGYSTSSARINMLMGSNVKFRVENTVAARFLDLMLLDDTAQNATVPGCASGFATTTGHSILSGGIYNIIATAKNILKGISTGITQLAPATTLNDTAVGTSHIHFSLDESGHNLLVKAKYSDGSTVRNATIAIT